MVQRGRKAYVVPTVEWKCHIPVDVAAKIDMVTFDPVKGKVKYGARSSFVTQLLRDWLASHGHEPQTPLVELETTL